MLFLELHEEFTGPYGGEMKGIKVVVCCLISAWAVFPSCLPAEDPELDWDFIKKVGDALGEINQIKVGMTRGDAEKVFSFGGRGISTRESDTLVYRKCPYIKMDVVFEAVGAPDGQWMVSSKDKLKKISNPYLTNTLGAM
jgi:hypothetical protein